MNTDRPTGLRVEHLGDAVLGIGVARPRLSWCLPAGAARQLRYRLSIDGAEQPWVAGADSVLVPWPAEPVGSGRRLTWRVEVETDQGASGWSDPGWFETGLLDESDWTARWITPGAPVERPDGGRPAAYLRRRFSVEGRPSRARLYATAHGIYETFLNGVRIGDHELTPGFTSYWDHLDVQTFDVTELLRDGDNEWTATLTDGWYRGKVGNNQDIDTYGDRTAFLAQLHADDSVVTTDDRWEWTSGPIVAADLMDGQQEDRRIELGAWQPVDVAALGVDRLTASPAPPSRRVEEIRPVSIAALPSGEQVVDLGQNIHGWVRLGDLGPAGTETTLVHGESLDDAGSVTLEHLCFGASRLRQRDRVIGAGEDGSFEPRHTSHGFRYVSVHGATNRLTPDDVTGVVVHTDLRPTGSFRCSDDRINRLHEITDWSFRTNACEIPTDCPQRERSGWTGDWQVFLPSAAFLYDVAGFTEKWLRSLMADQLPNGCLANMAPEPRRAFGDPDDLGWTGMLGSAGWGDAIVLVPWHIHQAYGDDAVLERCWPAMVRWVDWAAAMARERRHPRRAEARPSPAPHEQFLWDGGWHWGEWCEPGVPEVPFWEADHGYLATGYLHHSASLLHRIGTMLGHDGDAARFADLAAGALDAWRTECLDGDRLTPDSQAAHVRALAFDLVPDDVRPAVTRRLVELIREADTHLGTGFLSTPDLLPVLVAEGEVDLAFDLLFQDTTPSWLAMVDAGATTVWENWEGLLDGGDGVPRGSLNHYSKGAVVSFLHTHVAGIRMIDGEPAYRRFRVEPVLDRRITSAGATHDSPYGTIRSAWTVDGGRFELTVDVPAGTSAEIVLPDGARREQGPGRAVDRCDLSRR